MRINVYDGGRPVHGPSKVYLPVRAAFPLGLITGWSLIDRRAEEPIGHHRLTSLLG